MAKTPAESEKTEGTLSKRHKGARCMSTARTKDVQAKDKPAQAKQSAKNKSAAKDKLPVKKRKRDSTESSSGSSKRARLTDQDPELLYKR
ncbi:hypothetical protein V7S43_008496 [Phytophthora oleae]|uniref:Uncharacterized protein n=1 Tax=Phytophthora oleae TaxID=2107226 RepID=A0ABD3FK75_9STRA